MLKINIINLAIFIVTKVKFIVAKPTMAQLVMVKLIIMAKLTRAKPNIVKLTMVILIMVSFNFNFFFHR